MESGTVTQPRALGRTRAVPQAKSRFWDQPVSWWAAAGAALLAYFTYIIVSWILSDDFERIPAGPTPVPGWMQAALVACVVGTILLCIWMLWRFVYVPWRAEGKLTTMGAFGLATLTLWVQDPLQNFQLPWFSYNHWLPNMGSWINQFPMIVEPHGEALSDPVYASLPGFVLLYFGGALVGNYVMNKARERNPEIGAPKLMALSVLVCSFVFMCLELSWMRTGFYIYPNVIPSLTLFAGHYYQLPIYEIIIDGFLTASMSWIVFFRNDKGETVVERGLSNLKLSQGKKSLMSVLAFAFIMNLLFGAYNVVVQPFMHQGHTVPLTIQERSYFMGTYCGPGTDMACWNDALPIPEKNSAKVGPDGLLHPGSDPIPQAVPYKTTD